MIRRLIILLLIVGCVFGDTIVFNKETKDKDGAVKTYKSESMGEYVGILDAKVYLRDSKGKLNEYNCELSGTSQSAMEKWAENNKNSDALVKIYYWSRRSKFSGRSHPQCWLFRNGRGGSFF